MEKKEYEYCVVYSKPTENTIREKASDGWEPCDLPEGVIGRDMEKETKYLHSNFYFRKEKEQ